MNNVVGSIIIFIIGSVTFPAFFLVLGTQFPRRVARIQAMAASAPGRAFVVGLINFGFLSVVSFMFFVLADNWFLPILAFPGTVVLTILIISLIFGMAGMVQLIGERIVPVRSATVRTLSGALALFLACAAPFIGWFLLMPFMVFIGLGAFVLSFLYAPSAHSDTAPAAPQKSAASLNVQPEHE